MAMKDWGGGVKFNILTYNSEPMQGSTNRNFLIQNSL